MIRPADSEPAEVIPFPVKSSDGTLDHLSPSSMKLYLSCPLKFYFKKVLGFPEPCSTSLHLGKAVHAGLQAFHLARWRSEPSDVETILSAYRDAFSEIAESDPVEYPNDAARRISEDKGARVLRAYLESGHTAASEKPVGVEVKLEDDFPELASPLLGYIDLVRPGNIPVDFKTCAATPDVNLEAFQHELQLTAYQVLIEAATEDPVEARELVFLVKTKTPKVIVHRLPPADAAAKARFWSMANTVTDGIYHERFHPQPGMHCAWCAFRAECMSWRGGAT